MSPVSISEPVDGWLQVLVAVICVLAIAASVLRRD